MDTAPPVLARALLVSAAGERPGIDVPISAANVARLAPAAGAAAAVADHFRAAGFSIVGAAGGSTLGIAGPKELFEQHFGIQLVLGPDQAYVVGIGTSTSSKKRSAGAASDATSIPANRLPPAVRRAISQIALEAAASLDEPATRIDP
jgi:hypothetical protein